MNNVLIAIIVLVVLGGICGLVILTGRDDSPKAGAASKPTFGDKMSPTERWDKHIDKLRSMGA